MLPKSHFLCFLVPEVIRFDLKPTKQLPCRIPKLHRRLCRFPMIPSDAKLKCWMKRSGNKKKCQTKSILNAMIAFFYPNSEEYREVHSVGSCAD